MSDTATASPGRISRRATGGTGGIKLKAPTKKQADEDEMLLAVSDEEFQRRRDLAAAKLNPGKNAGKASRAEPRGREFLDEDGNPITRRVTRDGNPFDLPKHLWKDGWDYEWKVLRVNAEAVDPSVIVDYRDGGWRNAPAKDFKTLCPPGWDKPFVERGGQILMMRPMKLTLEARNESIEVAENQKYDKLKGALAGPGELGKVTRRITTEMKMQTGRADLHSDLGKD